MSRKLRMQSYRCSVSSMNAAQWHINVVMWCRGQAFIVIEISTRQCVQRANRGLLTSLLLKLVIIALIFENWRWECCLWSISLAAVSITHCDLRRKHYHIACLANPWLLWLAPPVIDPDSNTVHAGGARQAENRAGTCISICAPRTVANESREMADSNSADCWHAGADYGSGGF